MKIKVNDLKIVLNHLKPGLSGKNETTEQSNSIIFSDGMAYTYNDEIAVAAPFDLGVSGAVSSKELLSLAEKLEGEADISMGENELNIKCGKSKAGIRLDGEILVPLEEIVPKDIEWHPLPVEFKQAVKDTLFSTDRDASSILSNINCKINRVESTDSDRATMWTLPKTESLDFLLPADYAKLLVKYDKIEKWGKSEGWIHFKIEDVVFACRRIANEEGFPDIAPYFNVDGFEYEFPKATLKILDRADVFTNTEFDQDRYISININSKGLLRIRAEGDNGWFEETIRTRQRPEKDVQFSIHPQNLQKSLSYANTAVIGKNSILFIAENFKHVMALEVVL